MLGECSSTDWQQTAPTRHVPTMLDGWGYFGLPTVMF